MADTVFSSSDSEDDWMPQHVRRKPVVRKVLNDTCEIVGGISSDGESFESAAGSLVESRDSDDEGGSEKEESHCSSIVRNISGKSDDSFLVEESSVSGSASPQDDKAGSTRSSKQTSTDTTQEIFDTSGFSLPDIENDEVAELPVVERRSTKKKDNKMAPVAACVNGDDDEDCFKYSTPMVAVPKRSLRYFANLDITAIPSSAAGSQETGAVELDPIEEVANSSTKSIPNKSVSEDTTLPAKTSAERKEPSNGTKTSSERRKSSEAKKPSPGRKKTTHTEDVIEDYEDIVIAGIQDITLAAKKKFTFKKTNAASDNPVASSSAALPGKSAQYAGATCMNYVDINDYDFDDDEDESISANFDLDDGDSGNGGSDIQVLQTEPKSKAQPSHHTKPQLIGLDDSDDIQVLTEKFNKIPLGKKPLKEPSKIKFLEELPPQRPPVYAYDPRNAQHQEYYGDVQRTVSKLTETIESMPLPSDDLPDELPAGLVPLYDHQKYGLTWLSWREREFPGGGILADEMGLGKTIMIIALIMKSKLEALDDVDENWISTEQKRRLVPSRTTLVVCPVGCLLQWSDEIASKADKRLRVTIYHGPNRAKTTSSAKLAQSDVVLTTYQTVTADIPNPEVVRVKSQSPLTRLYWHRIVLDEAHTIRNPKTQGALAICQLSARHRWAVTGTPVHNKPADFYSLVKFLHMTPFNDPKVWDFWIGMNAAKKSKEAQIRLHTLGKALILRRTKAEVASMGGNVKSIPPKTIVNVEVPFSESEQRVYDHLMAFSQQMFKDFMVNKESRDRELQAAAFTYTAGRKKKDKANAPDDIKFSHLFALITRLRQCAVLPHLIQTMLEDEEVDEDSSFDEMLDEHLVSKRNPVFARLYESSKVSKILEDVMELKVKAMTNDEPMEKVVIVSSWTSFLNILHDHLEAKGFSCVFITGKEKMEERMDAMKRFNQNPRRPQIVLLSLAAGGVGLNLIGGNHVFFVEPHWNPQLELQAQDRVHRFGQEKPVTIKRYVTQGTIEGRVMELQQMKVDLADGVLSSTKKSQGGLSLVQMRLLFERP